MKRKMQVAAVLTVAGGIVVAGAFIGCGDGMIYSLGDRSAPSAGRETACSPSPRETHMATAGAIYSESEALDHDPAGGHNTESYDHIADNAFVRAADRPLSTFSIDVDTASYANVRRFLNHNQLPPPGAVRVEELINYFTYDYAPPEPGREAPFAVHVASASCPWKPAHRLVRIALKGREVKRDNRPPSNLVFLLDVSGSMDYPDKLPLLKNAMRMLVRQLGENDRVAIAVYASSEGLALPSTSCDDREQIVSALDSLAAGGSTAGGKGIQLAYKVAVENFIKGGVNRVILATDGDFNVGTTSNSELVRLIREKARSGVFLSVLGFGTGNLKDSRMEKLADEGNGNYAYIDSVDEARKVLVEQMSGTLVTIAKDVKVQVEFNPAKVAGYRLIGYENRMLRKEDFNDDTKDAGDIGAGHTVTALYQVVPAGQAVDAGTVDELRYQKSTAAPAVAALPAAGPGGVSNEMLTVKLRYKQPDGKTSTRMDFPVKDSGRSIDRADDDFKFAAAVASFGMILRDSKHKGAYTLAGVAELAGAARGADRHGRRAEFVELVARARELKNR